MILWLVLSVLAAMTVVMTASWLVQRAVGNAGWTDVFWTFGSGLTLAAAALWPLEGASARQVLVAALVFAWSLRLGLYVARRVAAHPEDARYAHFRKEWGEKFQSRMLTLSLPQAPATALLAVSVALAAHRPGPLGAQDALGVAILILAIAGEGLADSQMKRFKADPANAGKVCDAGLWGWSRHPNYFFEWTAWLAYPAIALDPAQPLTLFSFTAPVVMLALLTRGSGLPPLEAAMLRSKGALYADYQARVSAFFPLPPRKGRSA